MNYLYLLFDADDTLFDFPHASARAFHIMCRKHGIPDTPEVYALYHNINLELWAAFDAVRSARTLSPWSDTSVF